MFVDNLVIFDLIKEIKFFSYNNELILYVEFFEIIDKIEKEIVYLV